MIDKIKKYEPFVFYLLVGVHLLPVLLLHFFPTIDGPAHLYNSNLINQLLFDDSTLSTYFEFNKEPEPNWLGHFLLCLFNFFLPSFLAEKVVMLVYLVSLPLTFRLLVKQNNQGPLIGSYFIFPFIYTFIFYLGFYNFCISISLLFYAIYYWQKHSESWTRKRMVVFSSLLLTLYFAHLFSFLLGLFVLSILIIRSFFTNEIKRKAMPKQLGLLFLTSLPGLVLTVNFIFKKSGAESTSFLPKEILFQWLEEISPIITLNHDGEYIYSTILFYLLCGLFILSVLFRLKSIREKGKALVLNDAWLLIGICCLAAYFVLPDTMASGGYVSVRIALYFFLFLLIWLSSQQLKQWITIPAAVIAIVISLLLLDRHYKDSGLLSADASELYTAAEYIDAGSNVLPLDYSGNWVHANLSNYLGSEKGIIVLDNYEAAKPHFPLCWKQNICPYNVAGDFNNSNRPCLTIDKYEKISGIRIDYITRWYYNSEMNDSCSQGVNTLLQTSFERVYISPMQKIEVFKRKING